MNEMRKLMEAVGNVNESYHSRLAAAADDIALYNKRLPADELVELIRTQLGDMAAEYMREKIASGERIEEDEDYDDYSFNKGDRVSYRGQSEIAMGDRGKGAGTVMGFLDDSVVVEWDTDEYAAMGRFIHPVHLRKVDAEKEQFDTWLDQNPFENIEEDDADNSDLGGGDLFVNDEQHARINAELKKINPRYEAAGYGPGDTENLINVLVDGNEQDWEGPSPYFKEMHKVFDKNTGTFLSDDDANRASDSHKYSKEEEHELGFSNWLEQNPFDESLEEDDINEASGRVVEVPPELRGDSKLTGDATSEDARKFMADLGPDDDVSHDVVDPETGELLDWPTAGLNRDDDEDWRSQGGTKRERAKTEWEELQSRKLEFDDVPSFYLGIGKGFEDTQDEAWQLLNELRDSDFYNVVWREVGGVDMDTGDEDAFQDYDTEYEVPVLIKRKDGNKLTDDDHDNMRVIVKAVKLGSTMQNTGVQYVGVTDGGTTARFVPSFF